MSDDHEKQLTLWRSKMHEHPIESCGRLDMSTWLPEVVTVGRVTSSVIRYVYFEDGSEVVCLGALADHVAFRAADYQDRVLAASENAPQAR